MEHTGTAVSPDEATGQAVEEKARGLFDAMPSNNVCPRTEVRLIPQWDRQPEHIKDVFRRKAKAGAAE